MMIARRLHGAKGIDLAPLRRGFFIDGNEGEGARPRGPRAISGGYRPRGGGAAAPMARSQLDRDRPLRNGGRDRADAAALPMLRPHETGHEIFPGCRDSWRSWVDHR